MGGGALLYVPQVCFSYRCHAGSASSASLFDGRRFDGERRYFALAAAQARQLGWRRAEWAARAHLTSRAHAAALLPAALRRHDEAAVRGLTAHALRTW